MVKIEITKEMLKGAKTYIPLLEKQRIAEEIAPKCIARVEMSYVPTGSEEPRPLPQRYQELKPMTAMCLMGVLAKKYLLANEVPDDWQMEANRYDDWAGSHVINQIERFKKDSEISAKVFDLLSDYRELRYMVMDEIKVELEHHNDMLWRAMDVIEQSIGTIAKSSAMEMLKEQSEKKENEETLTQEQKEQLQKLRETLNEQLKKMNEIKGGLMQKREELLQRQNKAKGDD